MNDSTISKFKGIKGGLIRFKARIGSGHLSKSTASSGEETRRALEREEEAAGRGERPKPCGRRRQRGGAERHRHPAALEDAESGGVRGSGEHVGIEIEEFGGGEWGEGRPGVEQREVLQRSGNRAGREGRNGVVVGTEAPELIHVVVPCFCGKEQNAAELEDGKRNGAWERVKVRDAEHLSGGGGGGRSVKSDFEQVSSFCLHEEEESRALSGSGQTCDKRWRSGPAEAQRNGLANLKGLVLGMSEHEQAALAEHQYASWPRASRGHCDQAVSGERGGEHQLADQVVEAQIQLVEDQLLLGRACGCLDGGEHRVVDTSVDADERPCQSPRLVALQWRADR